MRTLLRHKQRTAGGQRAASAQRTAGAGGMALSTVSSPRPCPKYAIRYVVFALSYVAVAVECDGRKVVLVLRPLRVCVVLVLIIPETVHVQLRYEYVRTTVLV